MGYYNGSGVVTGGGVNVNLKESGPSVGGVFYIYNKTTSTVTTKSGVSLQTAQGGSGDINLSYHQWPAGMITPACKGTMSFSSYSRIGDSNLYELTETAQTVKVRGKQGTYDSGWVS